MNIIYMRNSDQKLAFMKKDAVIAKFNRLIVGIDPFILTFIMENYSYTTSFRYSEINKI